MKLSIIIPVYNERATILSTLESVIAAPLLPGWEKEIVVIDDGSTDGTHAILEANKSDIKILYRKHNAGKGAAIKDGFLAATGEYVLIQDADAEYDPKEYPALLGPIAKGESNIVFGSRMLITNAVSVKHIHFYGGLSITKLFNLLFKTKLTDVATCYKLFPRSYAVEMAHVGESDFVFDVVELPYLLVRKSNIVEVPITYTPRTGKGGKKLTLYHGWRCFTRLISLWFTKS